MKQAEASADMPINNAADSTAAPTTTTAERRNRHTNVERRDSDAKMNGSVQSTQNSMASNQPASPAPTSNKQPGATDNEWYEIQDINHET